jgi:hypothetical protein
MSDATPIDAGLEGLNELAACDLTLAKRFCARIEACTDQEDERAMALARSYQRMARSYRQTLVVQARLRREAKAEAKADAGEASAARRERHYNLKAAIRADIRPRIWITEREEERCEELSGILDELVDEAGARLDFLDHPPETHVAAILDQLDLDAEEDADEAEAEVEPPKAARAPRAPPRTKLQPSNGRLAPPREIPAWMDDDDTS